MISDSGLKKISLVVSAVGLVMLYAALAFSAPQQLAIGDITAKYSGANVVASGIVLSYSTNDGNIFMRLGDETGNISVVMFERTARGQVLPLLAEGDSAVVEGQVNIYKSEPEIIATSIRRV